MDSFVFIVGKADPQAKSAMTIRTLGYKVGIFQDETLPLRQPEIYDKVIPLNFNDLEHGLHSLSLQDTSIAGLICTYENYIPAKAMIGAYLQLPVASVESAKMSTDKYLMRQAFLEADPAITPRFALALSTKDLLDFAATTTYPLIIKPTNLVKSLLVLRCDNQTELLENFAYAQSTIAELYKKYRVYHKTPELIVEEFMQGKSCSIAAFVDSEGTPHFCDSVVSIITAEEHGVHDTYLYRRQLPAVLPDTLSKKLFTVAEKGVKALEMRSTPAHIELMYDGDDVKIIEIGARIGGYRPRMYRYSYGLDLIQQEIRLALEQKPKLEGEFAVYSAVYELFPEQEGRFKAIKGLDDAPSYTYTSVKPKPGQMIGPAKSGYKAAAVMIVVHKDKPTFDTLCRSVDSLYVEVAL